MDFLTNRSLVLEYYPVTLTVILITISVYYLYFKKKKEVKEVIAEEEYIGGNY